jgi:D-alanyl-D-alanine carboxypeptidase (penicillin-binding protein 5/6)
VASAERDAMRLTSVVMGTRSEEARARASLALLNYGFRFFESHKLYPGGQPVQELRVWMGDTEALPVGPVDDVYATVPRRQYDKLSARMETDANLTAPVAKGDAVGHIVLDIEGEEVGRVPLVALEDVGEGGWLQKAKDSVLMWF